MSNPNTSDTLEKVAFYHRVTSKEKALFFEHLANLVDGGVTVISAIASFLEKATNPRLRKDVSELLLFVESGDPVSTAMKKLPKLFRRAEVSIVEAGEQSGTLQRSFSSIATDLRDREEIRLKLKSALTYPFVILCFLLGAILLVTTYVIPKLLPLFETAGTELPFVTRSLVYSSSFVRSNLVLLIGIAVLAFFAFKAYTSTPKGRERLDRFLITAPLFGTLYRNYLLVRVASVLGLLLSAGIPILKTLRLTGESSDNVIFGDIIANTADRVEKGAKLAESFEVSDPDNFVFPKDFMQLIAAWEKTSTVNKVSYKIAEQYSREVDASITVLVKFVEPMAVLVAWVFVLWFAFAIFAAVMKITETVG